MADLGEMSSLERLKYAPGSYLSATSRLFPVKSSDDRSVSWTDSFDRRHRQERFLTLFWVGGADCERIAGYATVCDSRIVD